MPQKWKNRKKYAMMASDYILLKPENTTQHVNMLLSQPLERLIITSVEMESQFRTNLIMNDQSIETFIIDTQYTPGDSVVINMIKELIKEDDFPIRCYGMLASDDDDLIDEYFQKGFYIQGFFI